jgi:hypothetical protein
MSNFFLGFAVILLFLVMIPAMLPFSLYYPKVKALRKKLMKKIMWEPIYDFCNESYLIVTISIFINLYFWTDQGNTGKKFNLSISNIFIFLMVLGYPIFCLVFLVREYENLKLEKYREKFGSFYENF